MNKKIMSYALATAMVGSLFTLNVQALEQNTESISLPVQLYDYNADGLFYEYALYKGMDTFGLGTSDNEGETTGLIADQLGKDGLPVYKQTTVESAAKTIQDNLILGKVNRKTDATYLNYDIFNHFLSMTSNDGVGTSVPGAFGDNGKYFYNNGWTYVGDSLSNNGLIYENNKKGIIWEQDTDGVYNYGVEDHLRKTITNLKPNTKYKLNYWNQDNAYEVKVYDGETSITLTDNTFKVPESGQITIDVYNKTQERKKISAMTLAELDEMGNEVSKTSNYFGNINPPENENVSNFIKEGWVSSNYDQANKSESTGMISDGEFYWKQSKDGVVCLKDSSIIYQTKIPTGQAINLDYYVGWEGYNADGFTVDILDGKGTTLLQNIKLEEVQSGAAYSLGINVPKGANYIKFK